MSKAINKTKKFRMPFRRIIYKASSDKSARKTVSCLPVISRLSRSTKSLLDTLTDDLFKFLSIQCPDRVSFVSVTSNSAKCKSMPSKEPPEIII